MPRSLHWPFGVLTLMLIVTLAGRAAGAGADGGEWQLSLQTGETADQSGTLRFRDLEARGLDGTTARVIIAFGPAAQVRCRVIARSIHPFDSVRAAVEQSGAVAGVNGGYFDENGSPVGLLVSDGRRLNPFARARLLTGAFFVRAGRPQVQRTNHAPAGPVEAAVQCGPLLVERGMAVPGLDGKRNALRTFVLITERDKVAIGIVRSATLAQTAQILTARDLLSTDRTLTALNLDGGSSTGFFARTGSGLLDQPEWAHVADCLVFSPK